MVICLILLSIIIILSLILVKIDKSESFQHSYDKKCIDTCSTQSTNAPDQCLNDCQKPCNNKCWEDCFNKHNIYDDYLRCGVRCPVYYFSS